MGALLHSMLKGGGEIFSLRYSLVGALLHSKWKGEGSFPCYIFLRERYYTVSGRGGGISPATFSFGGATTQKVKGG